jgi:DUF2075 family protein/SOS-response transcriptional repressor LexA/DNA replication protein DnaC
MYVGETFRAYQRARQHLENPVRQKLKNIHIISDDEANKSATLDIESSLIEYLVADGKYILQNSNGGLQNHNYFDRERYRGKFEVIWEKLRSKKLAQKELHEIRNSDLFKYSPYKTLTDDQFLVANTLLKKIQEAQGGRFVVHGGPGTGKTIVASYIIKQLVEKGVTNVGLVIAMTALRQTLKKVFRGIPGLSPSMVIGPNEVTNKHYQVLLVDETHRLRRRRNIPNYGSFDATNRKLNLPKDADELDWVLGAADNVILFYDKKQSVRPSDIQSQKVLGLNAESFTLTTQMRVRGGDAYLEYVDNLLENTPTPLNLPSNDYEVRVFDDISEMLTAVRKKEKEHGLCRVVAGYAWEWRSKKDSTQPDIVIDGEKLFWNSQLTDWVNSPKALSEVGCIHTIQGYDLNYTGVIIGPEISFDSETRSIVIDRKQYKDANGHHGVTDPEELKRYIINIYKTLLTRGIRGTYIYIVDTNLREYVKNTLRQNFMERRQSTVTESPKPSPFITFVDIPLYDSVGCGDTTVADSTVQEMQPVPKHLMSPGSKYFVLRTRGDSMNKLGINDGDLILCQKNYQAPSGSAAVVLIGEDATLKKITYEKDALLLEPLSTNHRHKPYRLGSDDEFKVLGVFIHRLT